MSESSKKPCAVKDCPALTTETFCPVHLTAYRALALAPHMHCRACGGDVKAGDWVTVTSTSTQVTHARCPTPRPRRRKTDGLFDAETD